MAIKCPYCQSDVVESTLNDDTIVDVIDEDGEVTHELQVYECTNDKCDTTFCM
ncbi:hypothetical protein LCGC14_1633410 [marine sediment metagenome]|uniref:Uncharacterized protein n=1 Tax=marine sediment metagenome TaxID=412755 RepID=A0A0F9L1M0_9ZZZZ